jgi:hypothetical protein
MCKFKGRYSDTEYHTTFADISDISALIFYTHIPTGLYNRGEMSYGCWSKADEQRKDFSKEKVYIEGKKLFCRVFGYNEEGEETSHLVEISLI